MMEEKLGELSKNDREGGEGGSVDRVEDLV